MKLHYATLSIFALLTTSATFAENKYKLKAPSSLEEMKRSGLTISLGAPLNGLNLVETLVIGTSSVKKCDVIGVNLNWYQPGKMIVLTVPIQKTGHGD